MKYYLTALALSLFVGACATGQKPAPLKVPLSVDVQERPEFAAIPLIDESTESIRIEVSTRLIRNQSLRQDFAISDRLVGPEDARVILKLSALPVEVPARLVAKNIWELELSPNVLELLSKEPKTAEYMGSLELDRWGTRVPVRLVLKAPEQAVPHPRTRSAG